MRYSDSRKEDTRQLLLEKGAALLKQSGFAATGVDRLMQAAGLSGGALYAHYPSKTALLVAIVEAEMQKSVALLTSVGDEPVATALARCLDRYLTLEHVRQPERGCILPALAAELGRAGPEVKQVLDSHKAVFLDYWGQKLGDRAAAHVLLDQCVGAILMARMTADEAEQAAIIEASKRVLKERLLPA